MLKPLINGLCIGILILMSAACQEEKKEQISIASDEIILEKMNYLALGDSYTIGEGVVDSLRYPNQLRTFLDNPNAWQSPKIMAKTGWTVEELEAGINEEPTLEASYDLVTLLIGVNNQYRGNALELFEVEYEKMLLRAIGYAGDRPDHVVALSIPDWGITPFAKTRDVDPEKVAMEIDAYNQAEKEICERYGVYFIDITADYREVGDQDEMLVEDGLHPSGIVYTEWAKKLANRVNDLTF